MSLPTEFVSFTIPAGMALPTPIGPWLEGLTPGTELYLVKEGEFARFIDFGYDRPDDTAFGRIRIVRPGGRWQRWIASPSGRGLDGKPLFAPVTARRDDPAEVIVRLERRVALLERMLGVEGVVDGTLHPEERHR
jgi:hypothetical protein